MNFWRTGMLLKDSPPQIEFTFRPIWSLFIMDWQFASSCFPRTDFAAAVTFCYRSVELALTGTFAPLRQRFHSRTAKHLQCPNRGSAAGFGAEFLEHLLDVLFHRGFGNAENGGDVRVGLALR